MPNRAFIGIGSNLGDRAANYREAISRIAQIPQTRVVRQSSIYETEPVGDLKGAFLNGVIEIETELSPDALMRRLLGIERIMGRKRVRGRKPARGKYRPRIIDLDLLFFNKETIDTRTLTVPHPRLHERLFVLAPMSELAPTLIHPKLNKSISEMMASLKSPYRVTLARFAAPARSRIALSDLHRAGSALAMLSFPARGSTVSLIALPGDDRDETAHRISCLSWRQQRAGNHRRVQRRQARWRPTGGHLQ